MAATGSPREIIKEAYVVYSFFNGDTWLDMLKDRNDVAHIYDEKAARRLVERILTEYIPEFVKLEKELTGRYGGLLL